MKPIKLPPAAVVRDAFDYDAETGALRRKSTGSTGYNLGGYTAFCFKGKVYAAHRLIWLIAYGTVPDGVIDHINSIKTDNRLSNLRVIPHSENVRRSGRPYPSATGYRGISVNRRGKPYRAHIDLNGKREHLGVFATLSEAIAARRAAEVKYGCITE